MPTEARPFDADTAVLVLLPNAVCKDVRLPFATKARAAFGEPSQPDDFERLGLSGLLYGDLPDFFGGGCGGLSDGSAICPAHYFANCAAQPAQLRP